MYYTYTKSQPVNQEVRKKWKKQQKKLAKKAQAPQKLSPEEKAIMRQREIQQNKDLLCSGHELRVRGRPEYLLKQTVHRNSRESLNLLANNNPYADL